MSAVAEITVPDIATASCAFSTDRLFSWTVERYEEMIRAGVLKEDDRVELIEGYIVTKMGKNSLHITIVKLLAEMLRAMLPEGWHVGKEDPIVLERSQPEPDITVIRGRILDYLDRKPSALDIGLVIEAADSSLSDDRTLKKAIYAQAMIPTYWIVNLKDRRVEVHTDPTGLEETPTYRSQKSYAAGESIPIVLEGREIGRIDAKELFP